jgi:hypothetical protein
LKSASALATFFCWMILEIKRGMLDSSSTL